MGLEKEEEKRRLERVRNGEDDRTVRIDRAIEADAAAADMVCVDDGSDR